MVFRAGWLVACRRAGVGRVGWRESRAVVKYLLISWPQKWMMPMK